MWTEISTTESGRTIRRADMEHTSITTGPNMKDNGSKIISMAKGPRHGSMAVDMRVTMPRGRKMVRVSIRGKTAVIS